MPFVNCGAFGKNGQRIKTKKQLREELASDPASVEFDTTSMFDKASGYSGNSFPQGVTLTVVGPDPYSKRSWYASVSRKADGTIKVA